MGKDPAVLFYTSDFLAGTYTMSNEQVGMYIKLLCLQHQKKRLSMEDMLSVCVKKDPVIFAKFKEDSKGFYNERMEEEAIKRINYSKSRSNNRKKKKDMLNTSKTYEPHMENENEIVNIDINSNNVSFEDFWNLYDKKIDKVKCLPKWNRLKVEEKEAIIKILPRYLKANPELKYRKNPATFLNNRSWEDIEGIEASVSTKKEYNEEKIKMPAGYGNKDSSYWKERTSNHNSEPKSLKELIKK